MGNDLQWPPVNPGVMLIYDGTIFRPTLGDPAGHLQVDTLEAVINGALASLNTDALIVAGKDALNAPHVLLTDAAGHLQLDVLTSGLPAGAATSANQIDEINWLTDIDAMIVGLHSALTSVGLDSLRANVITSVLPAGASTAANQATEITSLQLIDDLRNALRTVALDDIRIIGQVYGTQAIPFVQDAGTGLLNAKITSSVLPTGAATLAEQQTQTTSLQLIDDLRAALASVATDSILLHGHTSFNNVLMGYNDRYQESGSDLVPAAGPIDKNLTAVPAGEIWVLTHVWAIDVTTAKSTFIKVNLGGTNHQFKWFTQTSLLFGNMWDGWQVMAAGDYVKITFVDNLAGDDLFWGANGFKIKVA